MKQPIAIGFWNDGSDDCPLHNPQEFVDPGPDVSLREPLFHYLRSGSVANEYLGYSWCRFDCGIDEAAMGCADLTDGVWIWPEGLAHYVVRHDVRLPNEFIAHARANGFEVPGSEPQGDGSADMRFWSRWCKANTSGDPDAQALWRRTRDEVAAAEQEIVEKLIEKHGGLADKLCMWAGCENRALRGLVFCPLCAHQKMNAWP